MSKNPLVIISGSAHPDIAQETAKHLNVNLCDVQIGTFANGEISFHINESVRGADVYIIQSHSGDVNSAILEQAIMIDSAKRASASTITAVCPFFGYARQDRKSHGREAISARLIVDIFEKAGADRIISVDLHTGQIQGFFNGPFDHLISRPVLVEYIKKNFKTDELVIVSPDAGRVKSAEKYSNYIGCEMAIIHKHRDLKSKNKSEAKHLIGEVEGKTCIIVDDMIDTAGTICTASELLNKHGAKSIHCVATHGLFSGPAIERINKSALDSVVTTDTLPFVKGFSKNKIVSVAPILSQAIKAIHEGGSVSAMFDGDNQF